MCLCVCVCGGGGGNFNELGPVCGHILQPRAAILLLENYDAQYCLTAGVRYMVILRFHTSVQQPENFGSI